MKTARLYIIITCCLLLSACSMRDNEDPRTIVVSIEPLRYFTEQIAGNRFTVISLVPSTRTPETYEPGEKQMAEITKQDMFIKVGQIGFEHRWVKKMETSAPHTIVVDASDGIKKIRNPYGADDAHTWMSTSNAIIIARNIYKALASVDKKDSLYFKANLESLISRINILDTHIREQITRDKTTAFLIYHPSLSYFAKDFHLLQIPIERNGQEPSESQLRNTIRTAKARKVKCLFIQKGHRHRGVKIAAKETGATIIPINPLSYKWEEEMLKTAMQLK